MGAVEETIRRIKAERGADGAVENEPVNEDGHVAMENAKAVAATAREQDGGAGEHYKASRKQNKKQRKALSRQQKPEFTASKAKQPHSRVVADTTAESSRQDSGHGPKRTRKPRPKKDIPLPASPPAARPPSTLYEKLLAERLAHVPALPPDADITARHAHRKRCKRLKKNAKRTASRMRKAGKVGEGSVDVGA